MVDVFKSEDSDILVAIQTGDQHTIETPTRRLGFIEDDVTLPDLERDETAIQPIGGNRKTQGRFKGQTMFEGGSLTVKPVDSLPFELLLLNQIDSSTGVIEPAPDQDGALSYTLQAIIENSSTDNFVRSYIGCVTGGGSITVDSENELVVDLDFDAVDISTDPAEEGSVSTTVFDKSRWSFRDTKSNLSMFGASFSRLNDFTADIDNDTTIQHYVESSDGGRPSEILLGNLEVTASLDINISDADIYDELISADNTFTTSLEFDNGTDTLKIDLLECSIQSADAPIPESGVVNQEVEIVANDIQINVGGGSTT